MIGHDLQCPDYVPEKIVHYCSSCENGIQDSEEYIENPDGEYRHCKCFHDMRDLLEWLGSEIKSMENQRCVQVQN